MSRLLKNKKVQILFAVCAVAAVLCIVFLPAYLVIAAFSTYILISVLTVLSYFTYRRLKGQMKEFSARSKVRNADCLIIGEDYDIHALPSLQGKTVIQIRDPGTSLTGAFEVLRRTYSILKPGGEAILFIRARNITRGRFTLFDLFFLHDITIKAHGLSQKSRMKKLILFFHPIKSMALLLNIRKRIEDNETYEDKNVKMFCNERGIGCIIYLV